MTERGRRDARMKRTRERRRGGFGGLRPADLEEIARERNRLLAEFRRRRPATRAEFDARLERYVMELFRRTS